MLINVIPMAVNIASGLLLWQTNLSLGIKVIMSVLIIVKYTSFILCSSTLDGDGIIKYICLGICTILNIGLVIYSVIMYEWMLAINIAVTMVLLFIWCSSMNFISDKGKKQ